VIKRSGVIAQIGFVLTGNFKLIFNRAFIFIIKHILINLSIGVKKSDKEIEEMLDDAPAQLNFTGLLTMMGNKMKGTDPEDTIKQAFHVLAGDDKGVIPKDLISDLLTTQADRFTTAELNQMFQIAPIDASGNLDYKSLCYIVTHGSEEDN